MKKHLFELLGWVIGLSLFVNIPAQASPPMQTIDKAFPEFSGILNDVMPAVVNVTVISEVTIPMRMGRQELPRNPGHPPAIQNPAHDQDAPGTENNQDQLEEGVTGVPKRFEEVGSGVIIKADTDKGYVVTNAHVIQNAKVVVVALGDGRRMKAKIVGADRLSDLAVLEINAHNLKTLPFGDSDQLKVGDFVAAIGNPFGLHQTVTSGMISALHRSDLGIEGYENFIQTDASINPGNSGGALIDLKGHLVGINTALIGPIGGNVGIGLAIPSDVVKQVADQLMAHGRINRGVLGVFVQDLTPALADAFNISGKKGALVTKVMSGAPAEKAGIQAQDVVLQANGVEITSAAQLKNMMALLSAGSKVHLQVLRKDKPMSIDTTVADPTQLKKSTESQVASFLEGVRLTSYDELVPDFGSVKGVGVLDVDETSDAWMGGLRTGDLILEANNVSVSNLDDLMHTVKADTRQLLLKINRSNGVIFLVINK